MLIVIFGESCTGKSTLAEQMKERLGGEVCTYPNCGFGK